MRPESLTSASVDSATARMSGSNPRHHGRPGAINIQLGNLDEKLQQRTLTVQEIDKVRERPAAIRPSADVASGCPASMPEEPHESSDTHDANVADIIPRHVTDLPRQ